MKLILSPTSPFARKVKVAILEKNLGDRTEWVMLDPWASPDELLAVNPLSQVPTLVTDDGTVLVGSESILGALEMLYPEPSLFPAERDACLETLAIAGLAHGLIECGVTVLLERRRPAAQQSMINIERKQAAATRTLKTLAERFDCSSENFYLDGVGLACALAWLDFRLPDFTWRKRHAALANWLDEVAKRPSMQASAPPA
jgi:glutathione S-transferase